MYLDVKLAVRRLLATPLFTLFAVMSLAAGVGVTTAIYSVIQSIFLQDLGIREPDRVAFIVSPHDGRLVNAAISTPDLEDLRAGQQSFLTLAGSVAFQPALASPLTTEVVMAEAVEGAYFSTLGVGAAMGRVIEPEDDRTGARVAVLSHKLWRSRFASDRRVVGQTIRISGRPYEVVGIAPPSFVGSGARSGFRIFATAVWIPLKANDSRRGASASPVPLREQRQLRVFGRLAPSATVGRASGELAAIAATLDTTYPPPPHLKFQHISERSWTAKLASTPDEVANVLDRFGLTLIGFVALVLVVACTNLGNLVLARGTTRQQELAVRYALGAPRWRLVREQLAESLVLAVAGGIGSYLVFRTLQIVMDTEFNFATPFGGGRWTLTIRPELDMTALVIAVASLLVSLVVFGLEPALQLTRTRDVRGEVAAGATGPARTRRHRLLLRWQVAISAGFFIVATMFVKYTIAEARHDSGVAMDRFGMAVLSFETQGWDESRARRTLDRVMEEARKEAAIASISISAGMPFGIVNPRRVSIALPNVVDAVGFRAAIAVAATPSLFTTIGVPIVRGRGFNDSDHAGSRPVLVLSDFTARAIFGPADAVGQPVSVRGLSSGDTVAMVVGVARDTDVGSLFAEPRPLVYLPLSQRYDSLATIAARSSGDVGAAVRALQRALRRADPDLAVDAIGTGREMLVGPFVFLRAMGMTTLALAALTLLLAMVGLFGIQSHVVSNRTREIGIRMSFGASASQIQRMVLTAGCRPVFEGLLIGLLIGLAGRAIVHYYMELEDVPIVDPWMLLVVPIPLILAGISACYLPAQRAASVDPMVALRHL